VPYCAKICPDIDKQHEVLVGQSNKKIVQWDFRANSVRAPTPPARGVS
jgi:hypothetical protein